MTKLQLWTSFVLLALGACQSQQQILQSPSSITKYTLDDILPLKHEESGNVKCCPPNTEYDGQTCIPVPICPEGTTRSRSKCVSPPICPGDSTFDNIRETCVTLEPPHCPRSMSFDGSFCIRPVPASTPDAIRAGDGYVLSDPPICRPSLDFNGKLCASEDVPSCPGQQRLMDGECVSPAKPRCVSGHTEDGETCVFSHCTDIEFCPGAQILCPRFHEKEFEISGQKVTIHCETCWQSDLDTIKVLGTHDMTDCMEAYLNHPECIGSNWFPDSKTCNCHSQSTTRTIKDGRCIALNAQRGQ